MQNEDYQKFHRLVVILYSELKRNILNDVYNSKTPKTLRDLSEKTESPFWRKFPHKMRPYMREMENLRLVSSVDGDRYKPGDLLELVISTTKRYPKIVKLRGGDSKNSDLNEEKILMYLASRGASTVKEITSHLKASDRAYASSITNLKKLELVRIATYKHKYFKQIKKVSPSTLNVDEKPVYLFVDKRDGLSTRALDILNATNAGTYSRGTESLLKREVFSVDKDNVVSYDLTAGGKSVASAIKKLYDTLYREERKRESVKGIDWEKLIESVRRVNKSENQN